MRTVRTEKIPIKIWAGDVEEGTLTQARNLANHPHAFSHIALMPDCHQGYGMPIGGVLATDDVIIPNCVGVDIGCGVRALRTDKQLAEVKPLLKELLNKFQRAIPTGFNHHKKPQPGEIFDRAPAIKLIQEELNSARRQLGTLGGGNHFIEIQRDESDWVWVMLHSGSRNFGKKVADLYNKKAEIYNSSLKRPLPREWQLSFLPLDHPDGREYITAMNYCLGFARENRARMMTVIMEIMDDVLGGCKFNGEIDVHHNYAARETHYGKKLIIHRKGAIRASGQVIIPGSMGTPSYIGAGRENPESYCSCSHGAGRVMGRNEAKRKISVEEVIEEMRVKGIELFKAKKSDVAEECSRAYKDIFMIMSEQSDLVTPVVKLQPIGVVKG